MIDKKKLVDNALADLTQRNGPSVLAPGAALSVRGTLRAIAQMIEEAFEQHERGETPLCVTCKAPLGVLGCDHCDAELCANCVVAHECGESGS